MLVNWLEQVEGGLPAGTEGHWEKYDIHTGQVRGPTNYFRRIIKHLNWTDNSTTNLTDHMGVTRELDDWQGFVYDGIKRARQQAWEINARNIHNYKGIDRRVDEATTRKYYLELA
eukprot:16448395-Heterocapsa_arctica.AAC.1